MFQWGDRATLGPVRTKAFGVLFNLRGEPIGSWCRANEAEQCRRFERPRLSRLVVDDLDGFEVTVTGHLSNFCIGDHLDVSGLFDPMHQIARHALIEVISADQDVHFADLASEKDRGLTGRITPADDDDFRPHAHLCLKRCSGVVNAPTLKLLATFNLQQAIVGPRGNQQTSGRHRLIALKMQHRVQIFECQPDYW